MVTAPGWVELYLIRMCPAAFERRLLTLRAERDEVVGLLRQDEEAREKAVLLENEIQVRRPSRARSGGG